MVESVPWEWSVHKVGFKYRVCIVNQFGKCNRAAQISNWLRTHLGDVEQGLWIDQYDYICFAKESDALLFEMTWT
jgi:hypothetical protein